MPGAPASTSTPKQPRVQQLTGKGAICHWLSRCQGQGLGRPGHTAVSPGAASSFFSCFTALLGIPISVTALHAPVTNSGHVPLLLQPNELPLSLSKSNERRTTTIHAGAEEGGHSWPGSGGRGLGEGWQGAPPAPSDRWGAPHTLPGCSSPRGKPAHLAEHTPGHRQ